MARVLSVFHFWLKLRPSSFILYLVSRLPAALPVSVLLEPDVLNSYGRKEAWKENRVLLEGGGDVSLCRVDCAVRGWHGCGRWMLRDGQAVGMHVECGGGVKRTDLTRNRKRGHLRREGTTDCTDASNGALL